MKTSVKTIILTAASIFAAMSCQKEAAVSEAENRVNTGETIQVSIDANLSDLVAADDTKATATQVVRLTWESSDQVDAYYGETKINSQPIDVNPSQNGIFAKLSGSITIQEGMNDESIITFVYSNVTGDVLTFDFSSQNATIPFVAYATVKYGDLTSNFSDKMVEFKFATSVMKIAATNLAGGNITDATISGINTKVTLAPQTNSETVTITGSEKETITKTAGFEASSDKTRAIFTVGLVPDNNTGRSITISQGDYTNKGVITSTEILSSKSYTTPASLFSCGKIGDHDYVLIAGTKWATQNLAITSSGKREWKGTNDAAVKVPGTSEGVIVGDYFQWAAYAGYCGQDTDEDKGLLIYNSFTNIKCVGVTGTDGFDFKSIGEGDKYGFNTSDDTSYKGISPYYDKTTSEYTNYFDKGAGLANKDDAARILWQDTWRMPTTAEFQAMRKVTYWALDAKDCGYYVFMPGLGTSGAANKTGIFNTSTDNKSDALLFFPAAGYGYDTSLYSAGSRGRYWSSTLYSSIYACSLALYNSNVLPQNFNFRDCGFSVRPVSD